MGLLVFDFGQLAALPPLTYDYDDAWNWDFLSWENSGGCPLDMGPDRKGTISETDAANDNRPTRSADR